MARTETARKNRVNPREYAGKTKRIQVLAAKTETRKTIANPSDKLIIGYENARGTGSVLGSLVITGTYAPTATPDAVNRIVIGGARVINAYRAARVINAYSTSENLNPKLWLIRARYSWRRIS